jgi:Asp-tRNA(Asn)/Glu-tRNA(Gln) amidotransferase B subunit
MDYEAVIGLETHVQRKTKSKRGRGLRQTVDSPLNAA